MSTLDPALAADGLDELLTGFLPRKQQPASGAPSRRACWWPRPIDHSAGPCGSPPTRPPPSAPTHRNRTLLLSGSAAGLYLGLWNRGDSFTVSGDETLAQLWRAKVRVRWS